MLARKSQGPENVAFKHIKIKDDSSCATVSFYDRLCVEQLNWEDFKNRVFTRSKLLKEIENNIFTKLDNTISMPECLRVFKTDNVTHFALRLICAQSRSAIKWFVANESILFKIRISDIAVNTEQTEDGSKQLNYFFEHCMWPHLRIHKHLDSLTCYDPDYSNKLPFDNSVKFHFTCCSDILVSRRYKIDQGFFEKNDKVLVAFMTQCFRKYLESAMNDLYTKLALDSDERLIKLHNDIFQMPDVTNSKLEGDISGYMSIFPLCIQGIIVTLKNTGHLKYNDRETLARFFKDIGISLNECIAFIKSRFKCGADQFDKNYLYQIRHNYGLEGKRANYSSFSCLHIISKSKVQDCFGCPFVNNHDYVKINSDIEDLDRDAITCCSAMAAKITGKTIEKRHTSPAEYFRVVSKENKAGVAE